MFFDSIQDWRFVRNRAVRLRKRQGSTFNRTYSHAYSPIFKADLAIPLIVSTDVMPAS